MWKQNNDVDEYEKRKTRLHTQRHIHINIGKLNYIDKQNWKWNDHLFYNGPNKICSKYGIIWAINEILQT